MEYDFLPILLNSNDQTVISEILEYNEYSRQFGLILTAEEAARLTVQRNLCLNNVGRVELSSSIVGKIISGFSSSPFISRHNYLEALEELVEIFYYFKNETLDMVGDDDLIDWMQKSFNTVCQGSLDLLRNRELEKLAHQLREGGER